ncbi:hypothetical protein [Vibrio sp. WXL210]|uniref:hypothetical protein n=1 Tax=Vibrio sp. WXL210 TaxID=3450709 RepID=UPI003EC50852
MQIKLSCGTQISESELTHQEINFTKFTEEKGLLTVSFPVDAVEMNASDVNGLEVFSIIAIVHNQDGTTTRAVLGLANEDDAFEAFKFLDMVKSTPYVEDYNPVTVELFQAWKTYQLLENAR